jgi:hypothetical protein
MGLQGLLEGELYLILWQAMTVTLSFFVLLEEKVQLKEIDVGLRSEV